MAHVIGFKIRTRLSYDALESILAQYCRKSFDIALGGLDTTSKLPRKIMILGFEDVEDRDRVRHVFAIRGATRAETPAATPKQSAA
jgi:hypothetical protein